MSADRAASALARLLNRSRSTGENYNLLLTRFVMERLLFRLSVSPHAGSFVLKGALLFALWYDTPHRPTKDADLLGFGADDADTLQATFGAICALATEYRRILAAVHTARFRRQRTPAGTGGHRFRRCDHARSRTRHLSDAAGWHGRAAPARVPRVHSDR